MEGRHGGLGVVVVVVENFVVEFADVDIVVVGLVVFVCQNVALEVTQEVEAILLEFAK